MADAIEVKFNTSQLMKALDVMPAKMRRKHLKAGVKAGGQKILEKMQAKCPVEHESPGPKSTALGPGVLKASLRLKQVATRDGAAALVGAPAATGHVALWVEKGFDHTGHGRSKAKRRKTRTAAGEVKHIPGTYFMQGAADEAAQSAVDAMVEAIRESMEGGDD